MSNENSDLLGLAGLHERIAASAQPQIIDLPGRDDKIIVWPNGTTETLDTRLSNDHRSHLSIGNAASLAAWLFSAQPVEVQLTSPTQVTVGGNGVTAEVFTGQHRHPIAKLPWYEADYQAATQPMTFPTFIDFLDGKGFVGFDGDPEQNRFNDVMAILDSLEFDGDKMKVTVKDEGAYTAITATGESATVKSATHKIPRFLHLHVARGAFDLDVTHRFKLRIDPKEFKLQLVDLNPIEHRKRTCALLFNQIKNAVTSLGADPNNVVTFIQASPLNTPDPSPAYPGPAPVTR